jgi:hypothetical protein
VAERVQVREITNAEGNRLLRILRRSSGSVVTRRRATYKRPHGVRHLLAAYDLSRDKLYGHIKPRKRRGEFLVFLRYVRSLYPPAIRIAVVLDNYSPHLSTGLTGGWGAGLRQQRRACLYTNQRQSSEPDRGAVHRLALLHLGRHRSWVTCRAGEHDSPLHRLAKPQRPR